MTEILSVIFLSKICIFLLFFQHVGTSSTGFTTSPSPIIQANIGDNKTLTWRFSLTTADKNNFQEVALGTRSSDDSFIKLVSVSRIGSVGTPPPPVEAASFEGRVFFVGNASLSRLGEFMLSDIRTSDNGKELLCAIKINIYKFSNKSTLSVGSGKLDTNSSPPTSSELSLYIIPIVLAGVIILVLVGAAVAYSIYYKKWKNAPISRPRRNQVQPEPIITNVDS